MIQNWITMYYVYLVAPHGKFHQTYFVDSCYQQHQKCWSFQRSYSAMSAKLRHGANPPSGLRRHRLLVLLAFGAQPEPKVGVVRCQWNFRIFSPCGLISLCVKQQFLQLETEVNCLLWRTHGGRSLKSSYWDAEIWHDSFRCFRLGGIRWKMFANFRRIRAISMRFEFAEDQILRTCLAAASGGVEVSAWILVCWFDSL